MRITVFTVLSLFMALGTAIAQQKPATPGGDEAALLAVEAKWDAANLKGDTAALAAILADTFFSVSPEGKVRNKAEMLAQMKSGALKYESAKTDELKVSVYGDAAVVNGRWKGRFVSSGKTQDATERFTDTFVRQNGQWRCVASHASTLK